MTRPRPTLDPVLSQLFAAGPLVPDMRVTELSAVRAAAPAVPPTSGDGYTVARLTDPGCDGWLYRPTATVPRAVVLLAHGGGWVIGSPEGVDDLAQRICQQLSALVVTVRYRLAPENAAPAAAQDMITAITTVRAAAAPLQDAAGLPLLIVGASAGGSLCAAASWALREERNLRPDAQLLFYPAVDLRPTMQDADSWRADDDPLLPVHNALWSIQSYLQQHDPTDPLVSPAIAVDSQLPPTVVVTAGSDPLRDQGAEYAASLASAGVAVRHRDEGDLCHGFTGFAPLVPRAAEAVTGALHAVSDLLF